MNREVAKSQLGRVAGWLRRGTVKSVQRGSVSIVSSASGTATITAVVLANSVIRFTGFTNSTLDQGDMLPRIELTNTTTVTAYRYDTSANTTTVFFEVTEYFPGVIRSVQRSTGTHSAGPTNTTITAVNSLSKTTLEWLGYRVNVATAIATYMHPTITLTSTTNVQSTAGSTSSQQFGFQVTEWY